MIDFGHMTAEWMVCNPRTFETMNGFLFRILEAQFREIVILGVAVVKAIKCGLVFSPLMRFWDIAKATILRTALIESNPNGYTQRFIERPIGVILMPLYLSWRLLWKLGKRRFPDDEILKEKDLFCIEEETGILCQRGLSESLIECGEFLKRILTQKSKTRMIKELEVKSRI